MIKNWIKILLVLVILILPMFRSYATPIDGTKVIDIRDFGASPSAPADSNTRAIQRAIDSASWGSTIIFPESGGAYRINDKLSFNGKQYVTVKGLSFGWGNGAIRLSWDSSGSVTGNLIEITNSQYCFLKTLRLQAIPQVTVMIQAEQGQVYIYMPRSIRIQPATRLP